MRLTDMKLDNPYVEKRADSYYIGGTRISLASLVYAYLDGHTAEGIQECYPLLTLEQIHGALAFYLGHRVEVEADLAEKRERYDWQRQITRNADPAFYERMATRRRELHVRT
jgi:uncharacterized protein (DUF433 family)